MKYNYDTVAWCYDRFSRLVFGNIQVNAQVYLLPFIPAGAHILIAGGGTGWLVEEIAAIHPSGLTITYVDASEKMVALAKERNAGKNKATYRTASVEDAMNGDQYDVIITPFLFDNFTQEKAGEIFSIMHQHLSPQGLWLYTDFHKTGILRHRLLMRIMYIFFRICCGVSTTKMPDIESHFTQHQYSIAARKIFMNELIHAVVYKKVAH